MTFGEPEGYRRLVEEELERGDRAIKKWLIKNKAKLLCCTHELELEPPEFLCLKCEEDRDNHIRRLRAEGWSDEDFRIAGWRKFEHVI